MLKSDAIKSQFIAIKERKVEMGYFRDEHWIIEGDARKLEKLRNEIIDEINKEFSEEPDILDYSNYVSPVLYGLANSYSCLFIPADGSKEGWSTSNVMDEVREKTLKKIIFYNAKSKDGKLRVLRIIVDEYKEEPEAEWITR